VLLGDPGYWTVPHRYMQRPRDVGLVN
jgi:hypothetical protein